MVQAVVELTEGPELRELMRQRDPVERDALEAVHDGDPEPSRQRPLGQARSPSASAGTKRRARRLGHRPREHGLENAVMIACDNATRTLLDRSAQDLLTREGTLSGSALRVRDRQFRVGSSRGLATTRHHR